MYERIMSKKTSHKSSYVRLGIYRSPNYQQNGVQTTITVPMERWEKNDVPTKENPL